MKRDSGDYIAKFIAGMAIALLAIVALAFVFGSIFFGISGVFALLGVQYDTVFSLFLFVLELFLVGIPFELVEKIVLMFGYRYMEAKWRQGIWTAVVKVGLSWMAITIVDGFMTSINVSAIAGFMTAFLFYLFEIALDDYNKEQDEK